MKAATHTSLAVILASSLALGEGAPPAAASAAGEPSAVPVTPPPPGGPTDLDFDADFPAPGRDGPLHAAADPGRKATRTPPSPAVSAAPALPRAWLFWTAGMAALAAGGAAWYLHWVAASAPDPVRNNQVFTDEEE